MVVFFFCKHQTAYEIRISDWSSDVCSSDLVINTPVMMVVAEGDDITLWDLEIDTFNAIPCPRKELVVLPHTTHITLYSDKARGMMAAEAGLRWLNETLR